MSLKQTMTSWKTTEWWTTLHCLEGTKTSKCTQANGGVIHRLNPLKSCVSAKWNINSNILLHSSANGLHRSHGSAFSDSAWRQTDVGRTFFHTNDVRIMPWSVFSASKSQTHYKLKCLVMKRDSLFSSILCSLQQQWQLVNVMISEWPHGLFIHHQKADNNVRKPKLCPLMYLGMKPTEGKSQI